MTDMSKFADLLAESNRRRGVTPTVIVGRPVCTTCYGARHNAGIFCYDCNGTGEELPPLDPAEVG